MSNATNVKLTRRVSKPRYKTAKISQNIIINCLIYMICMNNQKTIFAIVAVVAAIGLAATVATSSIAYAKITSQTTDTGCTNNGGNSPGGQQPTCTGGGLTQQQTTTNVNPAGHAPPGQN
jgi:hypothetical protein